VRNFVGPLIKLVVFLVVTALATYVLAVTIDNSSFGSTYTYRADFTDVSGLNDGDDVRIAGVRVGTVQSITLVKRGELPSYAQVSFTVDRSRPLPTSVEARLRYRNLIGQRYLDIEQGPGNSNGMLKPGDTIPLDQTQPAVDLTVLFAGFKPLVQGLSPNEINQLSMEIIKTLQGEGGSLQLLLGNLADLTNTLANKDHVIGSVVDNLDSVLTAVGNRDRELSQLIIELRTFVSGLAKDRVTIGNAITGVNRLTTTTSGLLRKVRPPLRTDLGRLSGLVGNLDRNSPTLTFVLHQLPPTLAGLVRTASYGSWFNFYLCKLSGTITLPGGRDIDLGLTPQNSAARCN
jgi:phospholipid/cholesterol/gamma-HCH transport system substrate-binding protein